MSNRGTPRITPRQALDGEVFGSSTLGKLLELQSALAPLIAQHEAEVNQLILENKTLRDRLRELGATHNKGSSTVLKSQTPRGTKLLVETILDDGRRFTTPEPPDMHSSQRGPSSDDMLDGLQRVPISVPELPELSNLNAGEGSRTVQLATLPEMPELPRDDAEQWTCTPINGQPLGIREVPEIDGKPSGEALLPGEVFAVSQVSKLGEGPSFLKLADGRGWVFDSKPGVGTMCTKVDNAPTRDRVKEEGPSLPVHLTAEQMRNSRGTLSWKCTPVNKMPLGIRETADVDSAQTGQALLPDEIFTVSETLHKNVPGGNVVFLKLADGRGWVFDRKPGTGAMCTPCHESAPETAAAASSNSPVSPVFAVDVDQRDAVKITKLLEPQRWRCQPANGAKVGIRAQPAVEATTAGVGLTPGEVFLVSETASGPDRILFLKLADGRGWAFESKPGVGVMCVKEPASSSAPSPTTNGAIPDPGAPWKCAPANNAKVGIRSGPALDAKQTGKALVPGTSFRVIEIVAGEGGVRFLRLADGTGWVFDRKPDVGIMCVPLEDRSANGNGEVRDEAHEAAPGSKRVGSPRTGGQRIESLEVLLGSDGFKSLGHLARHSELDRRPGRVARVCWSRPLLRVSDACLRGASLMLHPLAWATCAILVLMYGFAVLGVLLIRGGDDAHSEYDVAAQRFFGSIGDSMLSLFVLITGDGSHSIYRPLISAKPWLGLYFGAFWLLASVAVLNLLTAAVVSALLDRWHQDRDAQKDMEKEARLGVVEHLRDTFAGRSGGERAALTMKELFSLPAAAREHLQSGLGAVFHALDQDGNGAVMLHDFFDGLLRVEDGMPLEMLELKQRCRHIGYTLQDLGARMASYHEISSSARPPLERPLHDGEARAIQVQPVEFQEDNMAI